MMIKDNPRQKDVVNRFQSVVDDADKGGDTLTRQPEPDQRILEKKPDEQTHSRLIEEAEKEEKLKKGDWSGRRGSNSRHPPWQGGALPLSYARSLILRPLGAFGAVIPLRCLPERGAL
jgi:hypothetical protein